MTDNTDHKSASKHAPLTGKEFAARRTIVKGVASAVPVIMTIGSGQAMAMASSPTRCIGQDTGNPRECLDLDQPVFPIPGTSGYVQGVDGYVRKPVEECAADTSNTLSFDTQETEGTTKNCLVYVNSDGYEVAGCNTSGYPVATSCYNSFLPTLSTSSYTGK